MSIVRINSLGITDGTIVNADINASAGIDSTKISGLSSDFVRLSTSTITANTASVTFDGFFSSTYDTYIIYGNNVYFDASANFSIRYRVSGSDVTSNNYFAIHEYMSSANSSALQVGHPTTSPQLNGSPPSFGSDYGMNFCITIFDPNNNQGARHKHIQFETYYTNSSGYMESSSGGLLNTNSTSALSGFKILPSAGNFDAGTIVLYGVKK